MTHDIESLERILNSILNSRILSLTNSFNQLTLVVKDIDYLDVSYVLRNDSKLCFKVALDLAGVDYSTYGNGSYHGPRFAVVVHLLSIEYNCRLRLRTFASDDKFPILPSLVNIWESLNWFEREAFDLFGILFDGHPDLRRILTDYGFIGHPFRKDFPMLGYTETRYDQNKQRVIYEPVTIKSPEIIPRIIREQNYGNLKSS